MKTRLLTSVLTLVALALVMVGTADAQGRGYGRGYNGGGPSAYNYSNYFRGSRQWYIQPGYIQPAPYRRFPTAGTSGSYFNAWGPGYNYGYYYAPGLGYGGY